MRRLTWSFLALALLACGKEEAAPAEGAGGPGGGGAPPPMPVGVVTLKAEKLTLTTELPGRTSASLVAEVRPQVGGLLQNRTFTEGGDVNAGDVLYEIDSAPYEAAKKSAEANVARSQAAAGTAASRARRFNELAEGDVVAKQEREDAAGAARVAGADVAASKAALDRAAIELQYTQVKAPISGRIGRSMVTQGALVAAYQPQALTTIQQLDPIYVDVSQSTVDMLKMRKAIESGQVAKAEAMVELILEDGSVYEHKGTLQFADAAVDPSTGSITLRAVFPNPDKKLLPGMFVRARVPEGSIDTAVLVPQQGITRDAKGGALAMVVGANNMVEMRPLEVDRTVGDKWLVKSGLKPGDQVIVEGTQKIGPGSPVIPGPPSWQAPPPGAPGGAPGGGAPGGAPPAGGAPGGEAPAEKKGEAPAEKKGD